MKLTFRNLLGITLLIAGVAYVAAKGLVYYKFKNSVDTASAQMRIFATLQYEGISSSLLDSSVTLENVSILPSGFEDGIKIDSITLRTQDISYLLKGFDSRRGEFPKRLGISMKGLKIDLYGSMVDQLERVSNQLRNMMKGLVPSTCGNKLYLGPAEYREMGYDILNSDLDFSYKFTDQGIEMTYNWVTREVAAAIMVMKMTGPTRPTAMAVMNNPPQLTEISFAYQDLDYTKRSNEYCAKQGKREVAQYIEAEVNKPDTAYALQWGFVPGPGLKQAYKDFLTNPGSVSLTIRPPTGFNQNTIGLYKPEELPGLLNMELAVNEQPVTDLSFSFKAPDTKSSEKNEVVTLQDRISTFKDMLQKKDDETPLVQQPTPVKKGPPPRFHQVALNNLKKYKDRKVRVYTKNNKQIRYGRLAKISGSALHVTQDIHRGEFTMIIPKGDVAKVEVLY
jgi:hypothetical protein